jgi:hypothetical protein
MQRKHKSKIWLTYSERDIIACLKADALQRGLIQDKRECLGSICINGLLANGELTITLLSEESASVEIDTSKITQTDAPSPKSNS